MNEPLAVNFGVRYHILKTVKKYVHKFTDKEHHKFSLKRHIMFADTIHICVYITKSLTLMSDVLFIKKYYFFQ